jgi:hypothetical protein
MKVVGSQSRQILSWHRTVHWHPIFNPQYARENLISLVETFAMLFLYTATLIYLLHLLALLGIFEQETLVWLIIETNAQGLMFGAPNYVFESREYIVGVIIASVVVAYLVRRAFSVAKANNHPLSKRELRRFLSKQKDVISIKKNSIYQKFSFFIPKEISYLVITFLAQLPVRRETYHPARRPLP